MNYRFLVILLFLPLLSTSQVKKDSIKVYFLAGQSNMEGYGYNKDLPKDLKNGIKDVWIYHGNTTKDGEKVGGEGIWDELKPGHGTGFNTNGKTNFLSERFGIELSFARKLKELYPNEKFALIKYEKGGTSIDSLAAANFGCWEPDFHGKNGINQYDHALNTVKEALSVKDINHDGVEDVLVPVGILWMQGESDGSFSEEVAMRYGIHLKRLMDLFRASLRQDDLPVVIGKISDSWNDDKDGKVWDYGELIQYAQEKFARTDDHAAIIRTTRYYKYSDPWHYDSAGYIDFGEQFALAIKKLRDALK